MPNNLLSGNLVKADPYELRLLIERRIGGPGQYADIDGFADRLFIPLAGGQCQIVLGFAEGRIRSIEPGPAFNPKDWDSFVTSAESSLFDGPIKVGRDFSFSGHRVTGGWRGAQSGVQVCPPPDAAPRADVETADHPFILEFPVRVSDEWDLTNHRRRRDHRRLTRLLNVLLHGQLSLEPLQSEHFWGFADWQGKGAESRWSQRMFWAPFGSVIVDAWSAEASTSLTVYEPDAYAALSGNDGKGLKVPTDLDESINKYQTLATELREKFDRAAFWLGMAYTQWTTSRSASFASLVSAIESLTERGQAHSFPCPQCGVQMHHEVPGATRRFRDFLEKHAAGQGHTKERNAMYGLRSSILHGSALVQVDEGRDFGWDPPSWNERELHYNLWAVTKTALRDWLLTA